MALDLDTLKKERDTLKESLRDLEIQQRKLETEIKGFRQREIRIKREIEALSTLIEVTEPEKKPAGDKKSDS